MASGESRIQFVVSGPVLFLLLLSAGLMTFGFWLYTHQPPPVPVTGPPYFVNKVATAIRACFSCVGSDGKLKPQPQWKLGKTISIPDKETWWFAPVERSAEALGAIEDDGTGADHTTVVVQMKRERQRQVRAEVQPVVAIEVQGAGACEPRA